MSVWMYTRSSNKINIDNIEEQLLGVVSEGYSY